VSGEGRARPLAEGQIEALGELVGIGLKIARAIARQVDEAGAEPLSVADLNGAAMAYARVARAVRQTVMLQDRLQADRKAAAARAADLRVRVGRIVRRAIEDGRDDAEQVERLAREAAERLEEERYGDVLARPIGEIVADICKDLGLEPDWRGLAGEIAAAEAFARGGAGEAAGGPDEDEDELCWIGPDGKPTPVAKLFPNRRVGRYDPSKDPNLRRDSS
jgi:hypothetical protein